MMNLSQRFESKVDRSGGPDACHPWTGFRHPRGGRGMFKIGKRSEYAPRVAFFLEHGRWPEPCARHTCDNPPCCNATHLEEGTNAQNVADRVSRGRTHRHIPESTVLDIRANYLLCRVSQRELARRFGVSQKQVCNLVNNSHRAVSL